MKDVLQQLGVTENAAETFLALLDQAGKTTVSQLSKALGIPRATIYGHMDELVQKDLVKRGVGDRGGVFYAEQSKAILDLYDKRVEELKIAKQRFREKIRSGDFAVPYEPKFVVYDGPHAMESILWDVLRSGEKKTYWFWPRKTMLKTADSEIFALFHKERLKRGQWIYGLAPEGEQVAKKDFPYLRTFTKKGALREDKTLPGEIQQKTGYGIYGNKVTFVSSAREHFGFVVDSREMAQALKSQFDYMWNLSKPYKWK